MREGIRMSTAERHMHLLHNGRNQMLCIPLEFELEDEEALIRNKG